MELNFTEGNGEIILSDLTDEQSIINDPAQIRAFYASLDFLSLASDLSKDRRGIELTLPSYGKPNSFDGNPNSFGLINLFSPEINGPLNLYYFRSIEGNLITLLKPDPHFPLRINNFGKKYGTTIKLDMQSSMVYISFDVESPEGSLRFYKNLIINLEKQIEKYIEIRKNKHYNFFNIGPFSVSWTK